MKRGGAWKPWAAFGIVLAGTVLLVRAGLKLPALAPAQPEPVTPPEPA